MSLFYSAIGLQINEFYFIFYLFNEAPVRSPDGALARNVNFAYLFPNTALKPCHLADDFRFVDVLLFTNEEK